MDDLVNLAVQYLEENDDEPITEARIMKKFNVSVEDAIEIKEIAMGILEEKNMNNLEKAFFDQVREDLNYDKSGFVLESDPDKNYFNNEYLKQLEKHLGSLKDEKFGALEFKDFGLGRIKMCCIASSSRLCFWNYREAKDFEFEFTDYAFVGDNRKRNKAHFDGKQNNTFIECKCKEILSKQHGKLKAHFYTNLIKKEFGIKDELDVKDGYLFPTQKQFDICNKNNKSIYSLRFDVKQLITHLLALGSRPDKTHEVTLQYVVFRPTLNTKNNLKDKLYNELDEEYAGIKDSNIIEAYCVKNKIHLGNSIEYIDINKVNDLILKNK